MTLGFQPSLLRLLPPGVFHFAGMLDRAAQEEMREAVREIARIAPFVTPQMPGGTPFKLKATNAGAYGWTANGRGFSYERRQADGEPWPTIPRLIMDVAHRAGLDAGCAAFEPNNCLVNFYQGEQGSLGLHRDDTRGEDFATPIVTVSLGDSAIFGIGGATPQDKVIEIELVSGDVLVMYELARLYYHKVTRVRAGTSDLLTKGGRLSVTLRRVRR